VILGGLLFIPNWIFLLVFYYFFWISIPQIYGAYIQHGDYNFLSVLPIKRKDIVSSKVYALFILEFTHIVFAVIFGLIHNELYGSWNFFFDINIAFYGVSILLFGVFNITFLPAYFKTAHFFGKPLIYATIATIIFGFIFEFGIAKYQFMRDIFEGTLMVQTIVFIVATILGVLLSVVALKISQKRMMEIDL
jgi:ABC-type Na+ efflux pump permease subunit